MLSDAFMGFIALIILELVDIGLIEHVDLVVPGSDGTISTKSGPSPGTVQVLTVVSYPAPDCNNTLIENYFKNNPFF